MKDVALGDWIAIAHGIVSLFIVPTVYYLRGIYRQLTTLNERMIQQEEWSIQHNKQDDERYGIIRDRFSTIEQRVDNFHGTRG